MSPRTSRVRHVVVVLVACLTLVVVVATLVVQNETNRRRLQRAGVHLEQGMRLYQQKDPHRAEADLRLALRENPGDWKAPFYVGAIETEWKRYELALAYFERALDLNPTNPRILNALGVVYFKLGRLDIAKAYFWASTELDPTNRDAAGLMEAVATRQWKAGQAAEAKN